MTTMTTTTTARTRILVLDVPTRDVAALLASLLADAEPERTRFQLAAPPLEQPTAPTMPAPVAAAPRVGTSYAATPTVAPAAKPKATPTADPAAAKKVGSAGLAAANAAKAAKAVENLETVFHAVVGQDLDSTRALVTSTGLSEHAVLTALTQLVTQGRLFAAGGNRWRRYAVTQEAAEEAVHAAMGAAT